MTNYFWFTFSEISCRYIIVIVLGLFSGFMVSGQVIDSSSCYTILFENGRKTFASIDSIGAKLLYYQRCPVKNQHQYKIPIRLIKTIQSPLGVSDTIFITFTKLKKEYYSQSEEKTRRKWFGKTADKPLKKWLFKKRIDGISHTISEKQKIKVSYSNSVGFVQKVKGNLIAITGEHVIISSNRYGRLMILKENIVKINIYKRVNRVGKIGSWALLIGGVLLIGLVLSLVALDGSVFLLSFGTMDLNSRSELGCAPAIAALVGALLFLLISLPPKINNPFNGEWEVTGPTQTLDKQETYFLNKETKKIKDL